MRSELRRWRSSRPSIEPLEDRTLMSTCHVTRLTDQGIGKGFRGDLRYCINKVNAEPGPDVIDFTVTGTIELNSPLPSLADEIVLVGPDAAELIIDANQVGRVLDINAGVTAQIYGLTMTGGSANQGGGLRNAGSVTLADVVIRGNSNPFAQGIGIYNTGALVIYGSVISDNHSSGYGKGGGIHNRGTLAIYNSTISNNSIDANNYSAYGGAIHSELGIVTIESSALTDNEITGNNAYGGAIFAYSGVTLTQSVVANNRAGDGGGIYGGNVIVESCKISGNRATRHGGGIYTHAGSDTVVKNSSISGNVAADRGGGIGGSGTVSLFNSTVYGNDGERGGGIYNEHHLTLAHSTITANTATLIGGGIYYGNWHDFHMRNSIVAGNSSQMFPDIKGALNSSGFNLIGDISGSGNTAPSDLIGLDPLLGPLADNGGPTLTLSLLPGSPAIDAGDNTDAPEFDQRGPGFPRIVNGTIDIGSFEAQSMPIPPVTRPGFELIAIVLATADLDSLA